MDGTRVVAAGSVSLTGFGLLAGTGWSYVAADSVNSVLLSLVVLGALLGAGLAGAGVALYRSDVRSRHVARVAGWNLLGVAVLGAVLALATAAPDARLPGYLLVDVLGVSAVAHVLIGYNDVRRIRAEELADERRKLAVVNRVARHNLRNETQVLTAYADTLVENLEDPNDRQRARTIRDTAEDLATLYERLQEFQEALDDEVAPSRVELASLVDDVLADYRERYSPDQFEAAVPEGLAVRADDQLATALDHLVENAVTHGARGDLFVRVSASEHQGLVQLRVQDRGPGIPENEAAAVTGRQEITQLEHGSGLGLWVVRAVVDRYDGDLSIENTDDGAVVTLLLEEA